MLRPHSRQNISTIGYGSAMQRRTHHRAAVTPAKEAGRGKKRRFQAAIKSKLVAPTGAKQGQHIQIPHEPASSGPSPSTRTNRG
jgi:hypothetical protein